MSKSAIRYSTFPRTEPPPLYASAIVEVFRKHESAISTVALSKGLTSDAVLARLRDDLVGLGFAIEGGKTREQKIERPVFFGENGLPRVRYQIDGYHTEWNCGLEIEAGRGWMGNAVYRDLVQAAVMVEVDSLVLAVANKYKYKSGGRNAESSDYENTVALADALYGHARLRLPYRLTAIGY